MAGLSCWLLGAHFLRSGHLVLTAIMITAPLILLIREIWSVRVIQVLLGIAFVEWLRTLWLLVEVRRADGDPWMRLALILGVVALLAMGSALALERSVARRRGVPAD